MANKLCLSRFGRSLSLQSCFPETRSTDASGCKSPEDDDMRISVECYEDGINEEDSTSGSLHKAYNGISTVSPGGDQFTAAVSPEFSDSNPFASHSQNSIPHVRPLQLELNLQAGGSEFMQQAGHNYSPTGQSSNFDTKAHMQDGFTSFPLATVPYSGGISGEIRGNGLRTYVTLYLASLKGDWEIAKVYLDSNPVALRARISRGLETALHIAAGASHTKFVEELVKLMRPEDLTLKNRAGNTALCFAAASGIREIAEAMVNKNKKLPSIRGSGGALPLYMAALLGHKHMVWYLCSVTEEEALTAADRVSLLIAAITANLFDVALFIIQRHPELATVRDGNGDTALHVLARKPSAFLSGNQLKFWQRALYSCLPLELPSNSFSYASCGGLSNSVLHVVPILKIVLRKVPEFLVPGFKVIYERKLMHMQAVELVKQLWDQVLLLDDSKIGELIRTPSRLLFTAAELGIVEFIALLVRTYPDLIWKVDDQSRSIFHVAVAHRQEKVFNLIYEIGALKDLIAAYKDENNVNMLHLAGKLAPSSRLNIDSGAALQLRRELQWFKEVERIVQPLYMEMKDLEGRTPQALFTEQHKGLVLVGEKWMKDTASSCMLVATLIATVMFAAAFTVPGGNKNDDGRPIFLSKRSFRVFAISDALALFSSATSILIFLSILTSRYAEEDFLTSLPNRLVIGLATLFISITTMMIAFCATLFLVLGQTLAWVAIPMSLVAGIPVTLFAVLQFRLFVDVVSHTYQSCMIFRPRKHLLY